MAKPDPLVLLISGKAGSGKDTAAHGLKMYFEVFDYKVLTIHEADYLKFVCREYFDWDGKKDIKGRTLLQYVGTDIIRSREPAFWAKVVSMLINVVRDEFDIFIIPDNRFPNEINEARKVSDSVYSVRIIRKNYESPLTDSQKNHISEVALDNYCFDYVIENDSSMDDFGIKVAKLGSELVNKTLRKGKQVEISDRTNF